MNMIILLLIFHIRCVTSTWINKWLNDITYITYYMYINILIYDHQNDFLLSSELIVILYELISFSLAIINMNGANYFAHGPYAHKLWYYTYSYILILLQYGFMIIIIICRQSPFGMSILAIGVMEHRNWNYIYTTHVRWLAINPFNDFF